MLQPSYVSSLSVHILAYWTLVPILIHVWLYFGAKSATFCIEHIRKQKTIFLTLSPPPPPRGVPTNPFACWKVMIKYILTSRQKLSSYRKVDITIYECTCNMLICGGILLKFQQNTRFEMRNPINVEFIFCCVAF